MKNRVKQLEHDLIFYDEVPVQTLDSLNVMFEYIFELSAGLQSWFLIVDIRNTKPPTPEIRNRLQELYANATGLQYIVLITDLSRLLQTVVRFVAARSFKIPFTTVKDFDAALKHIESIKASTAGSRIKS